ncbi:MAG: hypothetical protein ACR2KK_19935 [Acidimicrobiales bacterium]
MAGDGAQVHVGIDQLTQPEVGNQRQGQAQAPVGDGVVVVEDHLVAVQSVGR